MADIPFDPQELFKSAEETNKKKVIETGITMLRGLAFNIFDNNSSLTPEESIALAQDMIKNGTGMEYGNLVKLWHGQWLRRLK